MIIINSEQYCFAFHRDYEESSGNVFEVNVNEIDTVGQVKKTNQPMNFWFRAYLTPFLACFNSSPYNIRNVTSGDYDTKTGIDNLSFDLSMHLGFYRFGPPLYFHDGKIRSNTKILLETHDVGELLLEFILKKAIENDIRIFKNNPDIAKEILDHIQTEHCVKKFGMMDYISSFGNKIMHLCQNGPDDFNQAILKPFKHGKINVHTNAYQPSL